jgi:RNA polymerase sigma-70 factor (ECF subfamily)
VEPTDLYLCSACLSGHPEALRTFERENAHAATLAIRRIGGDDDFIREVLQELWQRLLLGEGAKLRHFAGRGPLQAWVRVAATRVALDRQRAAHRLAKRQTPLPESLAALEASPEAALLRARFGPAFQEALRKALTRLSVRERNVLRMHAVGRCSIDEIGIAYDVHRATAARWIERARERIYDDVRRQLCVEHHLTASEFHSLATLLGTELDLSLGSNAQATAAGREPQGGEVA